jgi:hypothetical protein
MNTKTKERKQDVSKRKSRRSETPDALHEPYRVITAHPALPPPPPPPPPPPHSSSSSLPSPTHTTQTPDRDRYRHSQSHPHTEPYRVIITLCNLIGRGVGKHEFHLKMRGKIVALGVLDGIVQCVLGQCHGVAAHKGRVDPTPGGRDRRSKKGINIPKIRRRKNEGREQRNN